MPGYYVVDGQPGEVRHIGQIRPVVDHGQLDQLGGAHPGCRQWQRKHPLGQLAEIEAAWLGGHQDGTRAGYHIEHARDALGDDGGCQPAG